jgi:GNAT superfamily N-acetyltransferase
MKRTKETWTVSIREYRDTDFPAIQDIAEQTWNGSDYLAKIAPEWARDGHFYVAELNGRVIGATKLSLLPEGVAWLEGLRVHPDAQGHGVARQLNAFQIDNVRRMLADSTVKHLEFCTYFRNVESITMSERGGFRRVWGFYLMRRAITSRKVEPVSVAIPENVGEGLGPYLPVGWKSVHNGPEGVRWLQEHANGYRVGETFFYVGGAEPCAVIPKFSERALLTVMPALNHLFADNGEIEVLAPLDRPEWITVLKRHRFSFWQPTDRPNMLIFRRGD